MIRLTHIAVIGTLLVQSSLPAAITTFTDRAVFNAAVSPTPLTVEAFPTPPPSPGFFPISGGTLNSSSVIGSFPAGTIQAGVTYSTAVNPNNLFVIDSGGAFTGGFLEGIKLGTTTFPLTITFDNAVSAFGFDTSNLMRLNFSLTIKHSSGADDSFILPGLASGAPGTVFYGFQNSSANITQVVLATTFAGGGDSFALDNFTFTNDPIVTSSVPEPTTLTLFGLSLVAFTAAGYRHKKRAVRQTGTR